MITNIIVLASIIFVAIFVAAYKSKRQGPLHEHDDEPVDEPVDASIISENAAAPETGSIEYSK